jgi:MFS family permease
VAARGFPDQVPDELRPWTDPERLTRAAAVVALLGCALLLLSAHWASGAMARLAYRLAGLAVAGLAAWLAAGWFADQVPEEVRDWTAQAVITRVAVILALVFLAGAFWVRQSEGAPHARWLNRSLTPPALAIAVLLGLKWFGERLPDGIPVGDVRFVTGVVGAVATGTCLLIAGGAYLLRERPKVTRKPTRASAPLPLAEEAPSRSLPVALLLDERGRPVVPSRPGQAGSPGA